MQIKQVPITELKHAEYNPRFITEKQFEDIKKSIQLFGVVQPIVCNQAEGRENIIIGGNQRFEACKQLGFEKVPVFYVNVPDLKKEKELNIRMNKNTAEWDWELLANEFEVEDLTAWGFKDYELYDRPKKRKLKLYVDAETEEDLKGIFDKLTAEGYKCELRR